jgi:hypothetical protein
MNNRCAFVIFAHNNIQTNDDIDDMIKNINYFHDNCDFYINHPTLNHDKVKIRHRLGPLNYSSFIFGAFEALLKKLTIEEINSFNHFCLVSANQYFINKFNFQKNVNYLQFLNTENWEETYIGKDSSKKIIGFPLQQPYGRWDPKDMYKTLNIESPMSANWECAVLTNNAMLLAKEHIDKCLEIYPNQDMINIFPPYMALLSGEPWEFPKHFGTYDPSNKAKNWIITIPQVKQKYEEGYYSIKRVNYQKNCPVKEFIRKTYMV